MQSHDPLHVLQLGPLWVLSAMTGSGVTFTRLDRDVLWETVYAVSLRTPPEARALLESVLTAGADLFLDFELDERPLVSGLRQIAEVLAGMEAQLAADYKVALLRIGAGVARARGPYGRQMTPESEVMLVMVAELLDLRSPSEASG